MDCSRLLKNVRLNKKCFLKKFCFFKILITFAIAYYIQVYRGAPKEYLHNYNIDFSKARRFRKVRQLMPQRCM